MSEQLTAEITAIALHAVRDTVVAAAATIHVAAGTAFALLHKLTTFCDG